MALEETVADIIFALGAADGEGDIRWMDLLWSRPVATVLSVGFLRDNWAAAAGATRPRRVDTLFMISPSTPLDV